MLVLSNQHTDSVMTGGLKSFYRPLSPAACRRCWRSVCCLLILPKSCPWFLSTHLPRHLLFRDTMSQELMNSGRRMAQFSKFCLCCQNFFHKGSNVKWLPLLLHTWWHLWTVMYIDSWTNGFLLASSLLFVITDHTANGRHQHLIWQSRLENCIWCLR